MISVNFLWMSKACKDVGISCILLLQLVTQDVSEPEAGEAGALPDLHFHSMSIAQVYKVSRANLNLPVVVIFAAATIFNKLLFVTHSLPTPFLSFFFIDNENAIRFSIACIIFYTKDLEELESLLL